MNVISVALQEAVKREVNEALEGGLAPTDAEHTTRIRCECGSPQCIAFINIPVSEYERVRRHSRRFVIATGHEAFAVERVVERTPGYEVVEKIGEAGEIVARADPRSSLAEEPPTP